MVIRDQRHASVRKQTTLLDGIDVGPPEWRVCEHGLNRSVQHLKCKGSFKDQQWKYRAETDFLMTELK